MILTFYDTKNFESVISPDSMLIGEPVYFSIDWAQIFTPKFPVIFYASSCIVQPPSGEKSYEIIKNRCRSDLVGTELHSEKFSSKSLQLSYQSFAFTRTTGMYELSLYCTIDFCLRGSESKMCGEAAECPIGYSPLL